MKRNRECEYMKILHEYREKRMKVSPPNGDVYEFFDENDRENTTKVVKQLNSEITTKIVQQSNGENSTITDLNTKLKFEMIQGKRRGSKLLWCHNERQFYVANSVNKKGKAYTCNASKACHARIIVDNDGMCFRLNSVQHVHGTQEDLYRELNVLADIKLDVASSSSSRGTIQDIFNEHLSK